MKIFLISDNIDIYIGMRLVGVDGVIIEKYKDFINIFNNAINDKKNCIIILTKKICEKFNNIINKIYIKHNIPLIIKIPS